MGFTKRFEQLLSNPSIDGQTINWLQEYECDICGAEPLKERADFTCSVPRPGYGSYWQYRYEVCLDCVNAGIASFADRLRKHAQTLEEKDGSYEDSPMESGKLGARVPLTFLRKIQSMTSSRPTHSLTSDASRRTEIQRLRTYV
jgi:hypothetical protein